MKFISIVAFIIIICFWALVIWGGVLVIADINERGLKDVLEEVWEGQGPREETP